MKPVENIRFIETLQIVDGHFTDPTPHLRRIHATLAEIGESGFLLPAFADTVIPEDKRTGCVKCRYLYDQHKGKMEFADYIPRKIRTLRMVEDNQIDYHLKYADRRPLEALWAKRESCDDILIVKNGEITDTSYSNVVLYDGMRYVIPRSYLLNGIRRRQLLSTGFAEEVPVAPSDLIDYQCLYLINSMLDIKDGICVDVQNIF